MIHEPGRFKIRFLLRIERYIVIIVCLKQLSDLTVVVRGRVAMRFALPKNSVQISAPVDQHVHHSTNAKVDGFQRNLVDSGKAEAAPEVPQDEGEIRPGSMRGPQKSPRHEVSS